jgi:hypothetical protein
VHATLKHGVAGKTRIQGPLVSMACGRFTEMKDRVQKCSGFLQSLGRHIELARCLPKIVAKLGFATHSIFEKRGSMNIQNVRKAIYRTDLYAQFNNLHRAERVIASDTKRVKKIRTHAEKQVRPQVPSCPGAPLGDIVLRRLAWQHWLEVSDKKKFYSLPVSMLSVRSPALTGCAFVESFGARLSLTSSNLPQSREVCESVAQAAGGDSESSDIDSDGDASLSTSAVACAARLSRRHACEHQIVVNPSDAAVFFFKVVQTRPSSLKCVHGSLVRPFAAGDVAITIHKSLPVASQDPACNFELSGVPGTLGAATRLSSNNSIQILRTTWPIALPVLFDEFKGWATCGTSGVTFQGMVQI